MRFAFRPLIAAVACAMTVSIGACGSEENASPLPLPTTANMPDTGILPDAERRSAYEYFLSAERQQTIDQAIKTCGSALLAKLDSGTIPVQRSGGRKDEPAPKNGLGLLYSAPGYVAPEGEASAIKLTVYYIDGNVDKVHGIEVEHSNLIYTLKGWRVARTDGHHTDYGVDAYSWKVQHRNGESSAVMLGWPDRVHETTYGKSISLEQNFAVLGVGLNQLNLTDSSKTQITTDVLKRADTLFLEELPCQ